MNKHGCGCESKSQASFLRPSSKIDVPQFQISRGIKREPPLLGAIPGMGTESINQSDRHGRGDMSTVFQDEIPLKLPSTGALILNARRRNFTQQSPPSKQIPKQTLHSNLCLDEEEVSRTSNARGKMRDRLPPFLSEEAGR